jgi:virulence-associated protein VapD
MFRIQIELDREKIINESKVSYDDIVSKIDSIFITDAGFVKETGSSFVTNDNTGELARLMIVNRKLRKANWFVPYVKTWILYELEDDGQSVLNIEDVKAFYDNKYKKSA